MISGSIAYHHSTLGRESTIEAGLANSGTQRSCGGRDYPAGHFRYQEPSYFVDDDKACTTHGSNATGSIRREDFGMMWNLDIKGGGFIAGKFVDITFSADADLEEQNPAK